MVTVWFFGFLITLGATLEAKADGFLDGLRLWLICMFWPLFWGAVARKYLKLKGVLGEDY